MVQNFGLLLLYNISNDTIDKGVVFIFFERWHEETSSDGGPSKPPHTRIKTEELSV